MGDVANKGEAEKCRDLAKSFFQKGDYDKAARFFRKSHSLHPLPGVIALAEKAEAYARGEIPQTSSSSSSRRASYGPSSTPPPASSSTSSSSSSSSSRRGSAPSSGAGPSSPNGGGAGANRSYTDAQESLAKEILRKSKKGYYDVLGIEKGANDAQIKKAYRKLALKLHPDKNTAPSAEQAFKIISAANDCLSDGDKRRIYDQTGMDGDDASTGGGGGFRGHPFGGMGGMGGMRFQGQQIDPDDLINMFFGGGLGGGFGGPGMHFRTAGGRRTRQEHARGGGGGGGRGEERGNKDVGGIFSIIQTVFMIAIMLSYFSGGGEKPKHYHLDRESKISPLDPRAESKHRGYGNYATMVKTHDARDGLPFFVDPQMYYRTSDQEKSFIWKNVEEEWKQVYQNKCLSEKHNKNNRVQRARWIGKDALAKASELPLPACEERNKINDKVIELRQSPGVEFRTKAT